MVADQFSIVSNEEHMRVLDALYRFGTAVDNNDSRLLTTVFTDDAVIDFSLCGQKIGLDFPLLSGAKTIVSFLSASAESQVTRHVIMNGLVFLEGEVARVQTLVDATHILRSNHLRRFQMMNWYRVELIKVETLWRIRHLTIDNSSYVGEPQVLLGR